MVKKPFLVFQKNLKMVKRGLKQKFVSTWVKIGQDLKKEETRDVIGCEKLIAEKG